MQSVAVRRLTGNDVSGHYFCCYCQTPVQVPELQKEYICPVSGFSTKNVRTIYFVNFALIFSIKVNISLLFTHLYQFVVELWLKLSLLLPFYTKYVFVYKCPDFLQKMSGILDTRIPTFCNSAGNITNQKV